MTGPAFIPVPASSPLATHGSRQPCTIHTAWSTPAATGQKCKHSLGYGGQGPSTIVSIGRRFACPFAKNIPRHYQDSCGRMKGWDQIHRLKEHLYRNHSMPVICNRCHHHFETESERNVHLDVPDQDLCKRSNRPLLVGVDASMERRLRCRKRPNREMSDEDRWEEIYRIIFPNLTPPTDPYVEYPTRSPSSDPDLVRYEEFVREPPPHARDQFRHIAQQTISLVSDPQGSSKTDDTLWTLVKLALDLYKAGHRTSSCDDDSGSAREAASGIDNVTVAPSTLQPSQSSITDSGWTLELPRGFFEDSHFPGVNPDDLGNLFPVQAHTDVSFDDSRIPNPHHPAF